MSTPELPTDSPKRRKNNSGMAIDVNEENTLRIKETGTNGSNGSNGEHHDNDGGTNGHDSNESNGSNGSNGSSGSNGSHTTIHSLDLQDSHNVSTPLSESAGTNAILPRDLQLDPFKSPTQVKT